MKVRELVEVQLHDFLTALLSVEDTAVSTAWETGWPPGVSQDKTAQVSSCGESNHDSLDLHHVD